MTEMGALVALNAFDALTRLRNLAIWIGAN
jgi:hypothetical protein